MGGYRLHLWWRGDDVIVWPRNKEEHTWCREFLAQHKAAFLGPDAHFLGWVRAGGPTWIVGYNAWCGRTCQMHWASDKAGFIPREFRTIGFRYPFVVLDLLRVYGIIGSSNGRGLRISTWLGFKEVLRAEGCHDDGADLIVLEMRRENCKWIKDKVYGQQSSTPA